MNREPVLLLALAAAAIVLGIDLVELGDTVERVVELVAIVGGATVARSRAWSPDSVRSAIVAERLRHYASKPEGPTGSS